MAGRLNLPMPIERPQAPPAGMRALLRDLSPTNVASAVVGFVFAATGPVAIILGVATQGNLSEAQIASWLLGVFFLNSFLTVAFSLVYRQPLVFLWTIRERRPWPASQCQRCFNHPSPALSPAGMASAPW